MEDSMMGMDQSDWEQQWQGTEWEHGAFFPEVRLIPNSGPAGTQVSYTGTNLPPGANVTSISFTGQSVPLPTGGLIADSSGGFSGSFIVDEAWNFTPGMYGVEFYAENIDGWSQYIMEDFNLMRADAAFSLEATPDWIPSAATTAPQLSLPTAGPPPAPPRPSLSAISKPPSSIDFSPITLLPVRISAPAPSAFSARPSSTAFFSSRPRETA